MDSRSYLVVSGTLFGVVAILHLLRVVKGWPVEVGPWSVAMWISWVGAALPAFLCVWAFRLASRIRA